MKTIERDLGSNMFKNTHVGECETKRKYTHTHTYLPKDPPLYTQLHISRNE